MDAFLAFFVSYISLLMLICFGGIGLNAMMLLVLNVHSEIRTPQSTMLKNLCISDLVYLLGGTLLIVTVVIMAHEIMCFITVGFGSFVMALNVYSVAALSLQRYISLRKFRNTHVVDEKEYKYSLRILLVVWMLAIVLAVIEYILLRPDAETCFEDILMGIPLYRLVMYAILPIAIVAVFDIASCRLPAAQLDAPNEAMDREKEGKRMHFGLILLCFLTYSPAIFVAYVVAVHLDVEYRIVIFPLGSMLTTLNSFFHPIVMCIASKKLRLLFKDEWCCRRCCQQLDTSH